MDNFLIRLATKEDADEVLSLMRACFGERDFFHNAWYEWWNYSCPTGYNRNYVAIDGDKIVGAEALLPIRIKVNNQIIEGLLSNNSMVHPDYWGKGLFTQLVKYALSSEAVELALGVPNRNSYHAFLKTGWIVPSDLVFIAKSSFRDKRYKAREVVTFDDRMGRLLCQIAEQSNFMVIKDYRFLNWRYHRPDKTYRLFVFERGDDVDGYMALKYFDERGYKKTHILDIGAGNREAFDDLILAAESCARGRDVLNCWQIENSIYRDWFAYNGFVETEESNPLILFASSHQDIKPINWWFCLGDNDVY